MSLGHGNSIPIDNSTRIAHKIRTVDGVVVVCLPGTQKYLLFKPLTDKRHADPRPVITTHGWILLETMQIVWIAQKNATIITLQRIGKYTYYMINWPSIIRAIYNVTDGDHQYTKY